MLTFALMVFLICLAVVFVLGFFIALCCFFVLCSRVHRMEDTLDEIAESMPLFRS